MVGYWLNWYSIWNSQTSKYHQGHSPQIYAAKQHTKDSFLWNDKSKRFEGAPQKRAKRLHRVSWQKDSHESGKY